MDDSYIYVYNNIFSDVEELKNIDGHRYEVCILISMQTFEDIIYCKKWRESNNKTKVENIIITIKRDWLRWKLFLLFHPVLHLLNYYMLYFDALLESDEVFDILQRFKRFWCTDVILSVFDVLNITGGFDYIRLSSQIQPLVKLKRFNFFLITIGFFDVLIS